MRDGGSDLLMSVCDTTVSKLRGLASLPAGFVGVGICVLSSVSVRARARDDTQGIFVAYVYHCDS